MTLNIINHLALRRLFFTGVFFLCTFISKAQFSQMDDPAMAEKKISPFATLFESINNIVYTNTGYNSADQTWDCVAKHYRGNILQYFYYPELSKTDHRQFSLIRMNTDNNLLAAYDGSASKLIDQTEQLAGQDKNRVKMTYHFNSAGWLEAIITSIIYPEYEGFSEKSDSLYYDFSDERITQIRWVQHEWSSSKGNSTSECGFLPAFVQIKKLVAVTVSLDSFQNMTRIESRSDEQWDTCNAGGPKFWKRTLQYDQEGKLIRTVDNHSKYPAPTNDYEIRYMQLPLDTFMARVKDRLSFAPFREPAFRDYLNKQKDMVCIMQQRIATNFLRYDSRLQREVIRTDSPYLNIDTNYFYINHARQRIAVASNDYRTISVYQRSIDSVRRSPIVSVQSFKMLPDLTSAGTVVCNPIVVASNNNYEGATKVTNNGRLSALLSNEIRNNAGIYYPEGAVQSEMSAKQSSKLYIRNMAFADSQGLLRYLWLANNTYKLIYQ